MRELHFHILWIGILLLFFLSIWLITGSGPSGSYSTFCMCNYAIFFICFSNCGTLALFSVLWLYCAIWLEPTYWVSLHGLSHLGSVQTTVTQDICCHHQSNNYSSGEELKFQLTIINFQPSYSLGNSVSLNERQLVISRTVCSLSLSLIN